VREAECVCGGSRAGLIPGPIGRSHGLLERACRAFEIPVLEQRRSELSRRRSALGYKASPGEDLVRGAERADRIRGVAELAAN
jgi:hypothetical protein